MDREYGSIIAGILIILGIIFGTYYLNYAGPHIETVKIIKTESISTKNGHRYLVYTEDLKTHQPKVFSVEDLMFIGKFNASDTYAKLAMNKGKICKLLVSGHRVHILSAYPVIRKVIKCE